MSQALPPGAGGPQDVKLTEQEQRLVNKLLSDPTYFPLEFRTWLKNYIEGAGIMVSTSQVRGSGGSATRTGLPAGLIIICGGTDAVPTDAKVCDGAAYDRVVEGPLFAKIGTTWGAPNAQLFNVPDLRDRSLFGAGAAIGVGASDGHPFGSRSGWQHRHTVTDPGHEHGVGWGSQTTPGPYNHSQTENYQGDRPTTKVGTGITVGPAGANLDGPNWAGVILAITNGKAA